MDTSKMTFEKWDTRTKAACVPLLWKAVYRVAREKGYGVYCGYHGRNFTITRHADGWDHTFTASHDGLQRAQRWLNLQGQATSERVL